MKILLGTVMLGTNNYISIQLGSENIFEYSVPIIMRNNLLLGIENTFLYLAQMIMRNRIMLGSD